MNFERKLYGVRYWNLEATAIGIVAVANYVDGELMDWAAYIGATNDTYNEEAAYREAAEWGNKLYGEFAEVATKGYRDLLPMDKYRN